MTGKSRRDSGSMTGPRDGEQELEESVVEAVSME